MTPYESQQKYWKRIGYRPPTGAHRCQECGWHTITQGHIQGCPRGKSVRKGS